VTVLATTRIISSQRAQRAFGILALRSEAMPRCLGRLQRSSGGSALICTSVCAARIPVGAGAQAGFPVGRACAYLRYMRPVKYRWSAVSAQGRIVLWSPTVAACGQAPRMLVRPFADCPGKTRLGQARHMWPRDRCYLQGCKESRRCRVHRSAGGRCGDMPVAGGTQKRCAQRVNLQAWRARFLHGLLHQQPTGCIRALPRWPEQIRFRL